MGEVDRSVALKLRGYDFGRDHLVKNLGGNMKDVVRYGETIVLSTCDDEDHLFLGIVPRTVGRRHPCALSTEVSEAGKHTAGEYQWRLLPVVGSKRKWGDPVCFADRIRLQIVDGKGQLRVLAVSHLDECSIMAERSPARAESCTWSISYSRELANGRDGSVVPAGEFAPYLRYGDANFVTLVNRAGYLGARDDQYRILRKRAVLEKELLESGKSVWWRVYRSISDVVSAVIPEQPCFLTTPAAQARTLSVA